MPPSAPLLAQTDGPVLRIECDVEVTEDILSQMAPAAGPVRGAHR